MNRVQVLRYSVTGVRPTAATRQPGELYVNWADNALGVINAAQLPLDLVAVRFWNVLANYAVGDHVIYSGNLYRAIAPVTAGAFNPAQWAAIAGGGGGGGIPEAPTDGQLYGRKSAAWAVVPGGGGIPEAPNDGQQYGRQSLGWTVVATGAGIPDAPNDGTAYARKSAAWSHLTHGDITDWNATLGAYLPLTGGSMSGALTLAADPTAALGAATKQYVDAHAGGGAGGGANLVDNGDMSINQRGISGGAAVPSGSICVVDRWFGYATASRYSMGQNYNGLAPPTGFHHFLGAQCTSATAAGSSDYFALQQALEGVTLNGFNWGSSAAQPVALSFWACASLSGTFSGAFNNGANNRSFVFTFPLVANTPTKVTILVPGDTAGSWVNNGLNAQLFLIFDLGSGAGNRTSTINAWTAGDFTGQTGAAGIIGNNGAKFYVTGVKLELGSAATPFVYDPVVVRLARCQRYYAAGIPFAVGGSGNSGESIVDSMQFAVPMRAVPTVTFSSIVYYNSNGLAVDTATTVGLEITANITNTGGSAGSSAFVALSAEI
jgi:hypothetical protein